MNARGVGAAIGAIIGFVVGSGSGIVGGAFGAVAGVFIFVPMGMIWGLSAGPDLLNLWHRWRDR